MILIIKYSINKISLYMCGMFAKVSKCTGVTYPEKNIIKIIVEVTFIYLVSNAKSFLLPQIFEIDFIKLDEIPETNIYEDDKLVGVKKEKITLQK